MIKIKSREVSFVIGSVRGDKKPCLKITMGGNVNMRVFEFMPKGDDPRAPKQRDTP